ncbi:unnamed protein product [Rotaria sp. Silwood1]|nr:unnamed protein product [Rotaria sp. Silwood1]CAF3424514.1 unnamed protein product [Rotaria sp. Silwood1]CAF4543055.1 unnamed protein product [Rotaria sp. Silwood1]CAF4665058.1 unnamed protein product [Rotaria sp. Silwood1]
MLIPLFQVLFAAIRTISLSAVNLTLYSVLLHIFNYWLGFNGVISFICSAFCLSKTVRYLQRIWLNARLANKKLDEKIFLDQLTWQSPTTMPIKTDNENEPVDKFEMDWKYLLDDDTKNIFSSIVNVPFSNGWLFITTIIIVNYQMENFGYSYIGSLFRTIGPLIILLCGSTVRYQTLFERDKKNFFNVMLKKRDDMERYIIYSNNTTPIASACLQILNNSEIPIFMVQLYQLNSKFDDYLYDAGNYMCQKLIERIKIYGDENKKSVRLIWSFPTCRNNWSIPIKNNKLILKNTYKDFSFLPFVNSHVEQYEYTYEYKDLSSEIINDPIQTE